MTFFSFQVGNPVPFLKTIHAVAPIIFEAARLLFQIQSNICQPSCRARG